MTGLTRPDKVLAKDQLQALQALLRVWGASVFMRSMFWILTKQKHKITGLESSRLVPFVLNPMQEEIERNLALWNLLLKMRQGGATTYFTLRRLFLPAVTDEGIGGLLISQSAEYVQKHFQIIRRAYDMFGAVNPRGDDNENIVSVQLKQNLLHTRFRSKRELFFDVLDSHIHVASAEVSESGQGVTLQHIVASEYARWPGNPEETLSNVMGALVPGGTLDRESTGNGAGGPFFDACMTALNTPKVADAKLFFFQWWWSDEYRLDLTNREKRDIQADLQIERDKPDDETQRQEELLLIKKFHLDLNQIAWRRRTVIQQKANFPEKFPEDILTAFIMSGKQYFDAKILAARKMELTGYQPAMQVSNGEGQIFKKSVPGRRYLIGADPATGRTVNNVDSDYCAAVVIDLETGEEMAAYRARVTPSDFAADLEHLGRYYNCALIAVERTGDGGTVMLVLQGECHYPSVYKHRDWLRRNRKIQANSVLELEGFPTSAKTRPIACNFLSKFINEHPERIWDEGFINEALTFVRDERGIPAAMTGLHDDRVSCRWIAYYVRQVVLGYYIPWEGKSAERQGYIDADRLVDDDAA